MRCLSTTKCLKHKDYIFFFFALQTHRYIRADQTLSFHKNGESIHDKGLRMYFFACSLNEKTHEACTVSILKSSIQFLILLCRRNKVSNYTCKQNLIKQKHMKFSGQGEHSCCVTSKFRAHLYFSNS